ncbi:aldehyde dehydrogenase family protein [Salininema proteolyticum]|uniref:Aldehyde dehydrogenase family protein n=1 Tax=Salininema proteolyticum TaxID=1607685 RepID=A0ABV8U2Q0_9ACTN
MEKNRSPVRTPSARNDLTDTPTPRADQRAPVAPTADANKSDTASNYASAPGPRASDIDDLCRSWNLHLTKRESELTQTLTAVATHDSAHDELRDAQAVLDGAPAEIREQRPRRVKRICVFLPSNNLLYSYVLFGLVPSLYADEVLIRPSGRVKDTVLDLDGILRDLPGSRAAIADQTQRQFLATASEADMVLFSGRYDNMLRIRKALPDSVPLLHFGSGPNPIVVGPDADTGRAAEAVVRARMYNGGQDCLSPDLVIASHEVIDDLSERIARSLRSIERSDTTARGMTNPPLYYGDAFTAASDFLFRHRTSIVGGGRIDVTAQWIEPTLVRLPALAGAHPPELFSPIVCLAPYKEVGQVRDWLDSESERERGMYVSVFGEPALNAPVIGTSVNCGPRTAFDVEDGNRPFGGFGPQASALALGDRIIGRPLLASAELAPTREGGR